MQKMSVMARTRSKENVLDDIDQKNETEIQETIGTSNDQNTAVDAQITVLNKEDVTSKSNDEDNQKEIITLESKTICNDESKIKKLVVDNIQNEEDNKALNNTLENENEINNCSIEPNKEVNDKDKLVLDEKNTSVNNTVPNKDEESLSQCTMPPPMEPPRSWDFIQTSIMHSTDNNEKIEKETQENIEQIPDPIVCTVNTDDSELEWGSDESLPTDPNQTCPIIDVKKEENKKNNTFYNFITTKLMNSNKNRVSASAESIVDGTITKKHVRNKSFSSLGTFKLTVPSEVNKALHQLSPEMNFAHSSFSKSKSFNEQIPAENSDKNSLEFERSKSLCLEVKRNHDTTDNQQRDSDSQSDDSLRSKRSLLLSMRMPKVHDEHHDDYHLEIKDSETSEDEGPHYWYSPNKKNDKIIQQDTVIRNFSESEDSE